MSLVIWIGENRCFLRCFQIDFLPQFKERPFFSNCFTSASLFLVELTLKILMTTPTTMAITLIDVPTIVAKEAQMSAVQ